MDSWIKTCGNLCLVALALGLALATTGWAQHRAAPVDPDAWNERLEIGPVEGLTTVWHRAPRATAVPLGATVELRLRARPEDHVRWSGAREIERDKRYSVAEVELDRPGSRLVGAEITAPDEGALVQAVRFEVMALPEPLRVTDLRLHADQVVVDPERPNASSMQYFFRPGSIARLAEEGPGRYVTSMKRWLTAEARVEPAGFAPLLEWRLDGEPLDQLGAQFRFQSFVTREQVLEAGGEELVLETYAVEITSHERRAQIPDGEPVTFTARTEPPGYEERITWLASTKTGSCTPAMGEGEEFTVVFEGTTGAEGRWLGVKADNRQSSQDNKINEGTILSGDGFFAIPPGPQSDRSFCCNACLSDPNAPSGSSCTGCSETGPFVSCIGWRVTCRDDLQGCPVGDTSGGPVVQDPVLVHQEAVNCLSNNDHFLLAGEGTTLLLDTEGKLLNDMDVCVRLNHGCDVEVVDQDGNLLLAVTEGLACAEAVAASQIELFCRPSPASCGDSCNADWSVCNIPDEFTPPPPVP